MASSMFITHTDWQHKLIFCCLSHFHVLHISTHIIDEMSCKRDEAGKGTTKRRHGETNQGLGHDIPMLRMTIRSKRTAADERMVSNVTNKIVFISSVRMRQVTVFEERVRDEDRVRRSGTWGRLFGYVNISSWSTDCCSACVSCSCLFARLSSVCVIVCEMEWVFCHITESKVS